MTTSTRKQTVKEIHSKKASSTFFTYFLHLIVCYTLEKTFKALVFQELD